MKHRQGRFIDYRHHEHSEIKVKSSIIYTNEQAAGKGGGSSKSKAEENAYSTIPEPISTGGQA